MSGQVAMLFDNTMTAKPHIDAGRLKGIAISSKQRSSLVPNIPTIDESGLPGFDSYNWFGIYRWIVGGYAPGPYPGKLIFLWSNEADAGGSKWRSISGTQEIEEQIFPGVHVMYGNENLPLLAERLNAYLLEAQATIGHERA